MAGTHGLDLPVPGAGERDHVRRVGERIVEEIKAAGGAIPFARFMELALYAPGLGYYSSGSVRFGEDGDFVTAAEMSPLFGRCLAVQVAEALGAIGGGGVLEAGPGSGALAASLLGALAAVDALPERYLLLERSAALRARQRETLARLPASVAARVEWLDELPPAGFEGVVVANELLDAFPVRLFRRGATGVDERLVAHGGEGFVWTEAPAGEELRAAVEEIEHDVGCRLLPGYLSEVGASRPAWVATLGERLARGMVLVLDYGHARPALYHPQRGGGTLACHYRHRRHHDPLVLPGLQDISAHVDFTALARAGIAAGLDLAGFTTQGEFLLACGLLDHAHDVEPGTREHVRLTAEIKRLTLPGEMGELVKALALTRDLDPPLVGFAGRDFRDRLGT